jgi:anti-sigma factor RsiW
MMWGHEDANLVRLHDGLLDEDSARRVREHLTRCERCRQLDEAIRFSRVALESLSPVTQQEVDREKARAAMLASMPRRTTSRWRFPAVAAAVILIGVIAWWYYPHVRFVNGPRVPRSIESIAIAEGRAWREGNGVVTEPVASIETARSLVASHTGVVPNLQDVPRLLGLTQTRVGSAPASTLVYRIDDRPVVLVVARAERLVDPPPSLLSTKRLELRHDGTARVFTWSASGDAYSLSVPEGVSVSKACAVCHQGTRMMPLIEKSTRRM